MSDIVLSAGVRSNLLSLQQTTDLITQTQNRLATGKKVNSALDNAINFFTAQGLDNRANTLNSLLTQIGQLAGDSGFNGVNLLAGNTLTVTLNETATSTVSVAGVDYINANASPLSIANAANNWAGASDITAASTALSAALTSLQSESQTLSSSLSTVQIRQDFTKAMVNTLQSGSANLTLADSNAEGANLLALQTRQQLSSTALSLAAQADQNVLRLFR